MKSIFVVMLAGFCSLAAGCSTFSQETAYPVTPVVYGDVDAVFDYQYIGIRNAEFSSITGEMVSFEYFDLDTGVTLSPKEVNKAEIVSNPYFEKNAPGLESYAPSCVMAYPLEADNEGFRVPQLTVNALIPTILAPEDQAGFYVERGTRIQCNLKAEPIVSGEFMVGYICNGELSKYVAPNKDGDSYSFDIVAEVEGTYAITLFVSSTLKEDNLSVISGTINLAQDTSRLDTIDVEGTIV